MPNDPQPLPTRAAPQFRDVLHKVIHNGRFNLKTEFRQELLTH